MARRCWRCRTGGYVLVVFSIVGLFLTVFSMLGQYAYTLPPTIKKYNTLVEQWSGSERSALVGTAFSIEIWKAGTNGTKGRLTEMSSQFPQESLHQIYPDLAPYNSLLYDSPPDKHILPGHKLMPFNLTSAVKLDVFYTEGSSNNKVTIPGFQVSLFQYSQWDTSMCTTELGKRLGALVDPPTADLVGIPSVGQGSCVFLLYLSEICLAVTHDKNMQWTFDTSLANGARSSKSNCGCQPTVGLGMEEQLGSWASAHYSLLNATAVIHSHKKNRASSAASTPPHAPRRRPRKHGRQGGEAGTPPPVVSEEGRKVPGKEREGTVGTEFPLFPPSSRFSPSTSPLAPFPASSAFLCDFSGFRLRIRSAHDPHIEAMKLTKGTMDLDKLYSREAFMNGALNGYYGWAFLFLGTMMMVLPGLLLLVSHFLCKNWRREHLAVTTEEDKAIRSERFQNIVQKSQQRRDPAYHRAGYSTFDDGMLTPSSSADSLDEAYISTAFP